MELTREFLQQIPWAERAEIEENLFRKDFTQTEIGAIQERLAKQIAGRQPRGAPKGNGNAAKYNASKSGLVESCRDCNGGRTDSIIGKMFGEGRTTVQKRRKIIHVAEQEPDKYGDLIEEMNRAGRVGGVYKKLAKLQQIEQIQAEPPPLPDGKFRVLVVDPPWTYAKRQGDPSQRGSTPYPSLSIEEIKDYHDQHGQSIPDKAHDDCVLWLWTTNAHLHEAFHVAEHWGFQYKTTLTWVKNCIGTGDWLRGQTEHCLMCVKGKPVINLTNQPTVIHADRREHSQKPEEFYEMVKTLCPGSMVDIFSRTERPGVESHGNDTKRFN